ncbi:MAG TPA: tetratricopeptide repeat protein, partial [Gammaproteobacteria bacterium]
MLLGLAFCVAVYYPGLHGDFIFDDLPNITQNGRLQVDTLSIAGLRQAAFSADSGMLRRPVSMLSFWLNYYTTGLDPFYFKVTNLAIHLLNGIALFWLTTLLLQAFATLRSAPISDSDRPRIALLVAAIWLVHPLNVTSVLYVVQRMASLSTTFVILGLICYIRGRMKLARGEAGFPLILFGLAVFGALATFTKENGALLPLFVAVIEVTLFRFAGVSAATRVKVKALVFAPIGLAAVAAGALLLTHDDWLANQYHGRAFTPSERLMTEARVLWLYLRWAILPKPSDFGLFHDDVQISRSLLEPGTTWLAIVGIAAVVIAAVRYRKEAPLFAFGVFWYLAGHVLESSVIALELVFEHRNYLPIFGPLLTSVYALVRAMHLLPRAARIAVPGAFILAVSSITYGRAHDWADINTLRMAHVRYHPLSARSNFEAGVALATTAAADQLYDEIKGYFERATSLDRNSVDGLFGLILLNASTGRPVDEHALDQLGQRLSSVPLRFPIVTPFRYLLDWMRTGPVVLPRDSVVKLFEATLSNPTADTRIRSTLFSLLSAYHYAVSGDIQEAVGLAIAAVEENPSEPAHHLSLAELALTLGNFELAKRELDAVRLNDPFGRFALQAED